MKTVIAWMLGLTLFPSLSAFGAENGKETKIEENHSEVSQISRADRIAILGTQIDAIEFVDLPYDEALEDIRAKYKKATGRELLLQRIDRKRLGMKPAEIETDGLAFPGDTPITLYLNPGIVLTAIRETASLAQQRVVFWGDQIYILPLTSLPGIDMNLEVFRLDRKMAEELTNLAPALLFNNNLAVEPGVEGFIGALHEVPLENQGFAGLAKYFEAKGFETVPTQRQGSFAAITKIGVGESQLVAYNDGHEIEILRNCLRSSGDYLTPWTQKFAEKLAPSEGWNRVEACLEITDYNRRDELRLLHTLHHSLLGSDRWATNTDLNDDEIDERKKAMRSKMQATADRFVEALQFEVDAHKLIPQWKKYVPSAPEASAPAPGPNRKPEKDSSPPAPRRQIDPDADPFAP